MYSVKLLDIPDVLLLESPCFEDDRGFYAPTFSIRDLERAGINRPMIVEGYSYSYDASTVRGLHYQISPYAQSKLIRVGHGRIFDVVVDVRRNSPTFGRHLSIELSEARNGKVKQLYIPAGFAHGFATLEKNTEIIYKFDQEYAPDYQRGILWNDTALQIEWPIETSDAFISMRDAAFPPLIQQADLGD